MGISKLSEKCMKCDRKDTCDEKRMEACVYIIPPFAVGGIVSHDSSFLTHPSNDIENVGSFNVNRPNEHTQEIIDCIRKAVEQGINNCAFKVGD